MGGNVSIPFFSRRPKLDRHQRALLISEVFLKPCPGFEETIQVEEAKTAMEKGKLYRNLNLNAGALIKRICENRVRHQLMHQMDLDNEWPGFDEYRARILDANGHWPAEIAREGPFRIVH
ncbi:unnamed protein product [Caenorhabditis brenneri]